MIEDGTIQVLQPIPLPIICEPIIAIQESIEPTPHHVSAPDNTTESNTSVLSAKWITLFDTTSLEPEEPSTEIETASDSMQVPPPPAILAADGEKETTVPTCPSLPPRPRRPVPWGDTYLDIHSLQRSKAVMAMEEAAEAHSLAITIVDKSDKVENDLFMNIPLSSDAGIENKKQETGAGEHEEERWGFVCGFEWLDRLYKMVCRG
ncbi:hypothetical protein EV426DRAFT_615525 [Tirmania nivea]|nr:hypothetical protein EV426DRAFT_615525 [Tirmania nivea]